MTANGAGEPSAAASPRHTAHGVVAATGSFGHPYVPGLPGQDRFTGRKLHVASYRNPHEHCGERVIVVGAGNSAVQVAYELSQVATVWLATRDPVNFVPQIRGGKDVHYWLQATGFDLLPPQWLRHYVNGRTVDDNWQVPARPGDRPGRAAPDVHCFRRRLRGLAGRNPRAGRHRPVRHGLPSGLGKPRSTGRSGWRRSAALRRGLDHASGLVYVGLEYQRSFSSNTLRGVYRDAEYVTGSLAAHVRNAPAAIGLAQRS